MNVIPFKYVFLEIHENVEEHPKYLDIWETSLVLFDKSSLPS